MDKREAKHVLLLQNRHRRPPIVHPDQSHFLLQPHTVTNFSLDEEELIANLARFLT
jgi:hypothetical protein